MRELIADYGLWILIWLGCLNLLGFCLMGFDKRRARREGWRVRERSFFIVAALGGALGTVLGMYVFRHKTRHWYFVWGMPAILLLQLALGVWAWRIYFSL